MVYARETTVDLMGALASKSSGTNELNAMIKAGVSVAISTAQNCFPRLSQQQIIQIAQAHGNINISGNKEGQTIVMDLNCMASSNVTNDVQQKVSSQLSQMASRQITFIDHLEKAMMRIENKTYGICRVTGKLIDKARLRAVPHATLSIEAKQTMNK